jgi:hypothetical protein
VEYIDKGSWNGKKKGVRTKVKKSDQGIRNKAMNGNIKI